MRLLFDSVLRHAEPCNSARLRSCNADLSAQSAPVMHRYLRADITPLCGPACRSSVPAPAVSGGSRAIESGLKIWVSCAQGTGHPTFPAYLERPTGPSGTDGGRRVRLGLVPHLRGFCRSSDLSWCGCRQSLFRILIASDNHLVRLMTSETGFYTSAQAQSPISMARLCCGYLLVLVTY